MDTKYRLLQFDFWIQSILGAAILACFVSVYGFFFGIWGLIPFGAVQVMSGLIFSVVYRDKKRLLYLLYVAVFFLLCEKFRTELVKGCRRHKIDLVPFTTDQPYAEALAAYVSRRRARG